MSGKRAYVQVARAHQSEESHSRIVDKVVELLRDVGQLNDITLERVADRADTTVRTILRHFGSRDALLEAAFLQVHEATIKARTAISADGIEDGLAALMRSYEADGDLAIRGLAQEAQHPALQAAFERARAEHWAWLDQLFGQSINHLGPSAREQRLTELYAATDIYIWKLLRRDLLLGPDETAATVRRMVRAIIAQN